MLVGFVLRYPPLLVYTSEYPPFISDRSNLIDLVIAFLPFFLVDRQVHANITQLGQAMILVGGPLQAHQASDSYTNDQHDDTHFGLNENVSIKDRLVKRQKSVEAESDDRVGVGAKEDVVDKEPDVLAEKEERMSGWEKAEIVGEAGSADDESDNGENSNRQ